MTEIFGACGMGWKYEVVDKSMVQAGEELVVFVHINLFFKNKDGKQWNDPVPGTGSSKLYVKESRGMHVNDEAYKMATTDALGVAMKMIGVAADVYEGRFDGSKNQGHAPVNTEYSNVPPKTEIKKPLPQKAAKITKAQRDLIKARCKKAEFTEKELKDFLVHVGIGKETAHEEAILFIEVLDEKIADFTKMLKGE